MAALTREHRARRRSWLRRLPRADPPVPRRAAVPRRVRVGDGWLSVRGPHRMRGAWRQIVAEHSESRILMLTAAGSVKERVDGLGLGADDYLPKPFDFAELVARVRALARRCGAPLAPTLEGGDVTLDPSRRVAFRRRPTPRAQPQGVRPARMPALSRRPGRLYRGVAPAGVGRARRSLHHHGQDHDPSPTRQARRPADHPDRSGGWISDRRTVMQVRDAAQRPLHTARGVGATSARRRRPQRCDRRLRVARSRPRCREVPELPCGPCGARASGCEFRDDCGLRLLRCGR